MQLTPARALILSRATHATGLLVPPRAAAFPFPRTTVEREGGIVALAAVVMATATTANVVRHWNDGRR